MSLKSITKMLPVVFQSLSHVQLFATPWTTAHQVPRPSLSPGVCSNSHSLSWWYHLTISSSVAPFSSCPQSFPTSGSSPMNWLFASGGQNIVVSASALVLPMNIQGWFPCCPRDFQESSPAPQFESINSSALSLLYGPTLTSVHDYWKNDSFDYTDLCQQNDVSTF